MSLSKAWTERQRTQLQIVFEPVQVFYAWLNCFLNVTVADNVHCQTATTLSRQRYALRIELLDLLKTDCLELLNLLLPYCEVVPA